MSANMVSNQQLLDAINKRCSRRSYLNTPLKYETVRHLCNYIQHLNKESGLHFQLVVNSDKAFGGFTKSYGMFKNVKNYLVLAGTENDQLKEKSGYYGEKFVLEATRLGLGTCWVGGTYDKKSCEVKLGNQENFYCVITIGYVMEDKTVKEKIISSLSHRKSKSVDEMSPVKVNAPEWFLKGMEEVVKAPSAINAQPVIVNYENEEAYAYIEDESRFQLIDLGIAKLHFEIGAGNGSWDWGNKGKFLL